MFIYDPQNAETLEHIRKAEAMRRQALIDLGAKIAPAIKSVFTMPVLFIKPMLAK